AARRTSSRRRRSMRRTMSATAESVGIAREPQFQALLGRWQSRIESELSAPLPPATARPARLHEALRYSALGGGKRVRPVLAYATASALGLPESSVDGVACAVELIHAYSLVHDDLPAMDDADLRGARPASLPQGVRASDSDPGRRRIASARIRDARERPGTARGSRDPSRTRP